MIFFIVKSSLGLFGVEEKLLEMYLVFLKIKREDCNFNYLFNYL
jgi:hypothetical protein